MKRVVRDELRILSNLMFSNPNAYKKIRYTDAFMVPTKRPATDDELLGLMRMGWDGLREEARAASERRALENEGSTNDVAEGGTQEGSVAEAPPEAGVEKGEEI